MTGGMMKAPAVLAALYIAVPLAIPPERAEAGQSQGLRALHLRMTVDGGDDFVIVEPAGSDVRVRAVRVASASLYCPVLLVQAVERILPRTTVAAVAGLPVCGMSSRRVENALKEARSYRGSIDFIGRVDAVVADCGGADKEFVFIMPPLVDHEVLRRRSPDVKALWDLGEGMRALAFDRSSNDPFADAPPEGQAAREALGTAMVPVMLAGKYADYLKPNLAIYAGPPTVRDASWVEIVDRSSLNLAEYVEPVMPDIAKSARVFGDVRLRLRADAVSGAVTDVQLLPASPPLLLVGPAAVAAARRWRFAVGAIPTGSLDVTVRFRQLCP